MSGARTVIEGFHRTDENGCSVSYGRGITDPEALDKYLRTEQNVYGGYEARPVVIQLNDDGHIHGNCRGSVNLMGDDEHALLTVERAIAALEAVRDGLRETGHHDWEGPGDTA